MDHIVYKCLAFSQTTKHLPKRKYKFISLPPEYESSNFWLSPIFYHVKIAYHEIYHFNIELSGILYTHIVVEPLQLSISKTFS